MTIINDINTKIITTHDSNLTESISYELIPNSVSECTLKIIATNLETMESIINEKSFVIRCDNNSATICGNDIKEIIQNTGDESMKTVSSGIFTDSFFIRSIVNGINFVNIQWTSTLELKIVQ